MGVQKSEKSAAQSAILDDGAARAAAYVRVPLGSREGLNSFFAREKREERRLRPSLGRKEGRKMILRGAWTSPVHYRDEIYSLHVVW